ncbi:MAG: serine/threonine protein kinase [Deltaproteobacteria bacterium]|nr:serine/threonine protein kinase [Deltaproteobacteria bacterium]
MLADYENFNIEQELGRGATARIYRARDRLTRETVALKIFHPKLFSDPHIRQRIQREIRLAALLDHERIVKIRRVVEDIDPPALVLDYVDGENLETYQAKLPYILPEVSVLLILEVLDGVQYAHSCSLIHRDLKPENILVSTQGEVFVTDFGLAKFTDSTLITQPNMVVGSVDYSSPEQARGDYLSPISDLFSVASILYFLITGTRPFSRPNPLATLVAIKEEAPEPPQRRNPKVCSQLSQILCKALQKEPRNRFQSAEAFREALERYLDSLGLSRPAIRFNQWAKNPSAVTLEMLETAAQRLAQRCEASLKNNKRELFLEDLAHLSLKAPDSAALERLTGMYTTTSRKQKQGRFIWAFVAISALIIAAFFVLKPSLTQKSPNMITENVKAAGAVPTHPTVAPKPSVKGDVQFNVEADVAVYWDGKRVDARKKLKGVTVGKHRLLLERAGHSPIRSEVFVKAGQPTVINAR